MWILCCQWFNFELPIGWNELSVVATAVMAICTYFTLRNSRKQLSELTRAYSARLEVKVVICKQNYVLEIKNIGIYAARKIILKFNDEFISALPDLQCMRDAFSCLKNNPFMIEGGGRKLYRMIPAHDAQRTIKDSVNSEQVDVSDEGIKLFLDTDIHITGSYLNTYQTKLLMLMKNLKQMSFLLHLH